MFVEDPDQGSVRRLRRIGPGRDRHDGDGPAARSRANARDCR